ncbi:MAG TPA: triacylglycerol lipase [Pseudomonas sp.]|nr:triacylglycerol lipase [Pseudomonas sp.]
MNNPDDALAPRYPLVLVHGLLGFGHLLGYPYWYGIDSALRRAGVDVYLARISAVHGNEPRGEQLLERLAEIRQASGADKVNLLGHSQGALTARYAAAVRPEWVASVTSVAGPNHGSELADSLKQRFPESSRGRRLLARFTEGLARAMAGLDREAVGLLLPGDALQALEELSSDGVAAFNARYPQGLPAQWGGEGEPLVNGVHYYSWSGILGPDTDQGANRLDPSHLLCRRLSRHFIREAGQNDGMVGRFSSHLGTVIRSDYPLDHLDIVNQQAGAVAPGIDPVALYLQHARRLVQAGL